MENKTSYWGRQTSLSSWCMLSCCKFTRNKILLNSVISDSDKGARFMTLDLKDNFLASPMLDPSYMKIPQRYIPTDTILRYNQNSQRLYSLQNQKRNVWLTTITSSDLLLLSKKSQTIWLFSNFTHRRYMEAQNKTNHFLLNCIWFWS